MFVSFYFNLGTFLIAVNGFEKSESKMKSLFIRPHFFIFMKLLASDDGQRIELIVYIYQSFSMVAQKIYSRNVTFGTLV